jgi:hypothetical protein
MVALQHVEATSLTVGSQLVLIVDLQSLKIWEERSKSLSLVWNTSIQEDDAEQPFEAELLD